ncbi:MAG: hypothetical protein ACYTHM_23110 [Planctomycetota bacterium]|jgi:hypothetical protein
MAEDILQTKVPFPEEATIRDLLKRPELGSFQMDDILAVVVSSRRLSHVMPYLHKPSGKPPVPPQLPGGSILRGMVFGHISIYTNRVTNKEEALVLANPPSGRPQPAPQRPAAGAEPRKGPVKMVRMPITARGVSPKPVAEEPPPEPEPAEEAEGEAAPPEHRPFFSDANKPKAGRKVSKKKLKRWTEIIPAGTKTRRPQYPGMESPPGGPDPAAQPGPEAPPGAAEPSPHPSAEDPVNLAREADQLISEILVHLEGSRRLAYEERSDLAVEMQMLQLELDKFQPGIVRITEMIMRVSGVSEIQPLVARLKECLKGLGVLL